MRNVLFIVFALVFISCDVENRSLTVSEIEHEKKDIQIILDTWHRNAAEANFENYFKTFASESVFIGTDASENWTVQEFKEFSKPYFESGKAWNFKPLQRTVFVNANGKSAWFDELLNTWMGICRGSGVLVFEDRQWKLKHYVLSITIPNDNVGKIVTINKPKDSLFLRKILKEN